MSGLGFRGLGFRGVGFGRVGVQGLRVQGLAWVDGAYGLGLCRTDCFFEGVSGHCTARNRTTRFFA